MTSIMQMYSLHKVKLFYILTMTLPFNPARSKDLHYILFIMYRYNCFHLSYRSFLRFQSHSHSSLLIMMTLFKGISGHISNCRTRAWKSSEIFTLKQRMKHKLCKVWLGLQFSWGNHLLHRKKKSLRSFHDRIPIWQPISPSFLAMYCLPVFQIISESGWKWHFKSLWQVIHMFLYTNLETQRAQFMEAE